MQLCRIASVQQRCNIVLRLTAWFFSHKPCDLRDPVKSRGVVIVRIPPPHQARPSPAEPYLQHLVKYFTVHFTSPTADMTSSSFVLLLLL